MQILSILLIALATNLDNLVIGMALGLKSRRLSSLANLLIALCSAAATFLCCYLSSFLATYGKIVGIIGGALLILLGLISFFPSKPSKAEQSIMQKDHPLPIRPGEAALLGLTLAINCLAAAFSAGMSGLLALPTALGVGVFSFICTGMGNLLGLSGKKKIPSSTLSTISGCLMVALGIIQILF